MLCARRWMRYWYNTLRNAPRDSDLALSKQSIARGADPFRAMSLSRDTPIQEPSRSIHANIELLLIMLASPRCTLPRCTLENRFFLASNTLLKTPRKGRSSIPSECLYSGDFFSPETFYDDRQYSMLKAPRP